MLFQLPASEACLLCPRAEDVARLGPWEGFVALDRPVAPEQETIQLAQRGGAFLQTIRGRCLVV